MIDYTTLAVDSLYTDDHGVLRTIVECPVCQQPGLLIERNSRYRDVIHREGNNRRQICSFPAPERPAIWIDARTFRDWQYPIKRAGIILRCRGQAVEAALNETEDGTQIRLFIRGVFSEGFPNVQRIVPANEQLTLDFPEDYAAEAFPAVLWYADRVGDDRAVITRGELFIGPPEEHYHRVCDISANHNRRSKQWEVGINWGAWGERTPEVTKQFARALLKAAVLADKLQAHLDVLLPEREKA